MSVNDPIRSYCENVLDSDFKLDPVTSQEFFDRGNKFYLMFEFHDAVLDFTRAIELNPRFTLAYVHRAQARRYVDFKGQEASRDYFKALELEPNNSRIHYYFGASRLAGLDSASVHLTKSIELDPTFYLAYLERAELTLSDKNGRDSQYKTVVRDYDVAISLCPNNIELYIRRAKALEIIGEINLAIKDYEYVITLTPDNDSCCMQLVELRLKAGELDQALSLCRMCLERNPHNYEVKNKLTKVEKIILIKHGLLEIDNEILKFPASFEAYHRRSLIKINLNDQVGALQDLNKAIELNSEYAPAYYQRAVLKMNSDDLQAGLIDLNYAAQRGNIEAEEFLKNF